MNDFVIGGNLREEHDKNLQCFLNRASSKNLTISKGRCGETKLHFLGHDITVGTIAPDLERSAPFVNFPMPTTIVL